MTSGGKDIHELLRTALFKAHDAIMASTINNLPLKGMGTTLVIMVIRGNRAYICHVGDSRAYLIREGINMVTKDQTVGEYVVRHKKMRSEEVPRKFWHTLTQAVGVSKKIVPETKDFELRTGDILLLCSDGLSDMLSKEELFKIIKENRDNNFDNTANMLVDAANKKGGADNISVVLVEYKRVKAETERTSFSFN
jgi:protein phosphatase